MSPSFVHEGFVELFRSRPELAAGFLQEVFGLPMPDSHQTHAEPCDFTDMGPKEFRGDAAFAVTDASGTALVGIAVEVQLAQDGTRQWSWPVYLVTLRARLKCPVFLLVVTPDSGVAEWARQPIELGHPGLALCPLVLGPELVPAVTDGAEAVAMPERACCPPSPTPTVHRHTKSYPPCSRACRRPMTSKRKCTMTSCARLCPPRQHLEELMTTGYEYQSDFARKYVAEGRATEAARIIFRVLDARGISVSADVHARISSCEDMDQLEDWVDRAVVADTADDLFT
ncbi:hypothetical protein ACIA8C_25070 [Nocardia sp. NPDC051321]|uniref:hypothetical protein n=1 Tax=Nocardia sp. NPDC051321 TaxID=3364323 RepID=UPI0037948F3A